MKKINITPTSTQSATSDELDIIAHDYCSVPLTLDDESVGIHSDADIDFNGAVINVPDGVYNDTKEAIESKNATINASNEYVRILDTEVLKVLLEKITHTNERALTVGEVQGVTTLGGDWFRENNSIKKFNELKYFTGITSVGLFPFRYCSSLEEIDAPQIKFDYMSFQGNTNLKKVACKLSSGASVFKGVKSTSLDVSRVDTSACTTFISMFNNCSNLTSLNVSNIVTNNATTMSEMFANCSSLTSLDVSNFNTDACTNMQNMFSGCSKLKHLYLPQGITKLYSGMLNNCSSLESIDIPQSVTVIQESALVNLKSVKRLIIPDSVVESNGGNSGFDNVEVVVIGSNFLKASTNDFRVVNHVTTFVFKGLTPPERNTVGNLAFGDNYVWNPNKAYVPVQAYDDYINWKKNSPSPGYLFHGGIYKYNIECDALGLISGDGTHTCYAPMSNLDLIDIADYINGVFTAKNSTPVGTEISIWIYDSNGNYTEHTWTVKSNLSISA